MRIDERVNGRIVIIEPKGRLILETEECFTKTVQRLVVQGHRRLVLNMAEVTALDGRGLGAIAQACVAARDRGGDLILLNVTPRIRRMLTVTGLLTTLSTCDSEAEAERWLSLNVPSSATGDREKSGFHDRSLFPATGLLTASR